MEARKVRSMTQSTTAFFCLRFAVLAAAVVGCLLVAPYTRAHEEYPVMLHEQGEE